MLLFIFAFYRCIDDVINGAGGEGGGGAGPPDVAFALIFIRHDFCFEMQIYGEKEEEDRKRMERRKKEEEEKEEERKYQSIFFCVLWRPGRIDFQCFETENSAAQLTIIRRRKKVRKKQKTDRKTSRRTARHKGEAILLI